MVARLGVTMTRLGMIVVRLFAALQRVKTQIQISVINSYRGGVVIVVGNRTSVMMAGLWVTMTRLGMIMVWLFAALQLELESKFKCQ